MAMDDDLKAEKAIEALIAIAMSNFPAPANIRISTDGTNTASVMVTAYVLQRLVQQSREAHSR